MKIILKKLASLFKDGAPSPKSKEAENEEIIYAYNLLKKSAPDYTEPNYESTKKVFVDFNDSNLLKRGNIVCFLRSAPKTIY